ncbi:ECF transporter S component [Actinomadura harenae]|uniref:ECF transporter S component n=1 Tax=Actinomadura harenae TaxID=2483351 RepID=A0A3M2LG64_9ACTN|nr:ECF transporter S component [Actinomadura harenae]
MSARGEGAAAPRRRVWGRADQAVRLGPRSAVVLTLASAAGLMMFVWPLLVRVQPQSMQHGPDAPFVFVGILPVVIIVVLAELTEGGMDSKALAMLGVLSAVNAALRPLGAGTAGIETVFFMLVLAGRVFGAGFGFALGCTSLFASALLTAGVGPWLPFQMMCSAWIGMGAGLLPRRITGKAEIAMLVAYGIVVAYLFGFLMNLWFWPFITGAEVPYYHGHLSYVPGAPLWDNLRRFTVFTLLTSTAGWDTGRAITNSIAIVVLGPAVLTTLRRASRKASYGVAPTFGPATAARAERAAGRRGPRRVPGGPSARGGDAVAVGDDDEVDAVPGLEFGEEAADVGLGRALGDVQARPDLGVGVARRDEGEDVELPAGDAQAVRGRRGRTGGEGVDEAAGDGRGEERVPADDGPDPGQQVVR